MGLNIFFFNPGCCYRQQSGEDAALSNKLDFVEEETMKQIARLRQQQQQQHREGGLEI